MRSFACVLYSQDIKLLLRKTDTSEHKTVASERLNGVDTHTAHHFLYFVIPCVNEIYKALVAYFGVKTLYQVGALWQLLQRWQPIARSAGVPM